MLSYCLKSRKIMQSKHPEVVKIKNRRKMHLSKCAMCNSKKSKFLKEQESREFFSSLGIRTPLSQILLVGHLLFTILNTEDSDYLCIVSLISKNEAINLS